MSRLLNIRNKRKHAITKINAFAKQNNTTYAKLINKTKLNRHILANLAQMEPKTFQKLEKGSI